jgi:hypothetical protein
MKLSVYTLSGIVSIYDRILTQVEISNLYNTLLNQ